MLFTPKCITKGTVIDCWFAVEMTRWQHQRTGGVDHIHWRGESHTLEGWITYTGGVDDIHWRGGWHTKTYNAFYCITQILRFRICCLRRAFCVINLSFFPYRIYTKNASNPSECRHTTNFHWEHKYCTSCGCHRNTFLPFLSKLKPWQISNPTNNKV